MTTVAPAPPETPTLLLAGHVTRDLIDGEARLGGAVTFAARAAAHLGVRTAVLTAAPPADPLLAPLARLPGVTLKVVPSDAMTTFAIAYQGARRWLTRVASARRLRAADLPPAWRRPPVALVAPVGPECPRALVDTLGARATVIGAQGWLRGGRDGEPVEPALSPEALELPRRARVLCLSEEDHPAAGALAARWAEAGRVVALTRGADGVTILNGEETFTLPAERVRAVDPTGAGDVFALVFGLALAGGAPPREAARHAIHAAALTVAGSGLGHFEELDPAALRPYLDFLARDRPPAGGVKALSPH